MAGEIIVRSNRDPHDSTKVLHGSYRVRVVQNGSTKVLVTHVDNLWLQHLVRELARYCGASITIEPDAAHTYKSV